MIKTSKLFVPPAVQNVLRKVLLLAPSDNNNNDDNNSDNNDNDNNNNGCDETNFHTADLKPNTKDNNSIGT